MELIKRIKDRAPEYPAYYKELISKLTITQGGMAGTASEREKWEQGKYFSTVYEIYMYATILGLKKNYKIPNPPGTEMSKFIEIKSWQPSDLADYIISLIIAKSEFDLNVVEEMEEQEIEKEVILKLRKLMEEYANGGFDLIRSKMDENPSFFEDNENCLIDLMDETQLDK